VGEDTAETALELAYKLRLAGFSVEQSYSGNMKKRMIKANKANACKAVIIGSDELAVRSVTVKDLDSGEQKTVAIEKLIEELQ
jgi:histidyl-tRNA synthetase